MGSNSLFGQYGAPPSIDSLLAEWWGGPPADPLFCFDAGLASNLAFGGNPVYQVSDFLAAYPKFGASAQAIASYALVAGGAGYAINDTLTPVQADSSGAVIKVLTVNGSGAITSSALVYGGTGYSVTTQPIATATNGAGTGATLNIVSIAAGVTMVPPAIIQMYITLANASLQKARWLDTWQVGMNLFVAHFVTLYLQSEGQPTSNAGQVAASGIARGILVSKSAGDVSGSYQAILNEATDLWGSFVLTTYGQQLITFARIIGAGPMYVYG